MNKIISYDEIKRLDLFSLTQKALNVKLKNRGLKIGLCTISNAKCGGCSEDCAFCAQSSVSKAKIKTFNLKTADMLLKEAEEAKKSGAQRFSIVISGRGPNDHLIEKIAEIISKIKNNINIKLCASLGIMDEKGLAILKEAGLKRYHHNIESSEEFFPKICTTHSFIERIQTIVAAKKVGLEVCAGGIIGLGEDEYQRFLMAKTLNELQVDSCPINILVPIKDTPLEKNKILSIEEILRAVAIFRLLLPKSAIRIAGGREKILGDFQVLPFLSGADAMLIGGYLTTRGRSPQMDLDMSDKIKELWKSALPH